MCALPTTCALAVIHALPAARQRRSAPPSKTRSSTNRYPDALGSTAPASARGLETPGIAHARIAGVRRR